MIQPRGTLSTRRMTAHRVVLAAAVLTTVVAAAIGAALAVLVGQGLPPARDHDLSVAPGTALSISGPVSNAQTAATASALRSSGGGTWSDPLALVPAAPGRGNTALLKAAAVDGITGHAVLVSGQWPGPPAAGQAGWSGGGALADRAAAQLRALESRGPVGHVEGADVGSGRDDLVDPVE